MPRLLGRSARRRSCTLSEVAMISPAKKKGCWRDAFGRQLALKAQPASGTREVLAARLRLFATISARHEPIVGSTMASSHGHRPGGDRL